MTKIGKYSIIYKLRERNMTQKQSRKTEDFLVKSYITIYVVWGVFAVGYSVGKYILEMLIG